MITVGVGEWPETDDNVCGTGIGKLPSETIETFIDKLMVGLDAAKRTQSIYQ